MPIKRAVSNKNHAFLNMLSASILWYKNCSDGYSTSDTLVIAIGIGIGNISF